MIGTFSDIGLLIASFLSLFFTIFWLLVLLDKDNSKISWLKKELPSVSVIIPAYNEEKNITKTLECVANLEYDKDKLEIIVVNDGSNDKTEEKVMAFIKAHKECNIKLINQENQGKATAMNNGLKVSNSELFASLDADSFIERKALKSMIGYFNDPNVAVVCPLLKVYKPKTLLQRIQWYEYLINMFYKILNAKLDCMHVTPGPFSLYRTDIVKKLGGYDPNALTEDMELAIRLQKYHYKLVQDVECSVYTITPENLKGLYKQRNRWYKGTLFNAIQYRKLFFNKAYGDFGFAKMPMIIASTIVAVLLLLTFVNEMYKNLKSVALYLYHSKFDLITLAIKSDPLIDFMSFDYMKIVLFLVIIALGIAVIKWSHDFNKESILKHKKVFLSLAYYLFVYGLFTTTVWLIVLVESVVGKKQKW